MGDVRGDTGDRRQVTGDKRRDTGDMRQEREDKRGRQETGNRIQGFRRQETGMREGFRQETGEGFLTSYLKNLALAGEFIIFKSTLIDNQTYKLAVAAKSTK